MLRLLILVVLSLAWSSPVHAADQEDTAIQVGADDPAMASAIKNARRTLPHFWATFAESKKGESEFALKVRIEDEHGIEHFWCGDIERKGAAITGIVNNDPNVVQSVKIGQRIPIAPQKEPNQPPEPTRPCGPSGPI